MVIRHTKKNPVIKINTKDVKGTQIKEDCTQDP